MCKFRIGAEMKEPLKRPHEKLKNLWFCPFTDNHTVPTLKRIVGIK
jgi:hypothetical protein